MPASTPVAQSPAVRKPQRRSGRRSQAARWVAACGSGLFGVARRLAHSARRTVLHLNNTGRWTDLQLHMINALRALPAPAS